MPERIPTGKQVVEIPTLRGILTVGPGGRLGGLEQILKRELRTNEQVREMCGGITRHTLIRWRTSNFPAPIFTPRVGGGTVEFWSRTDVEAWLRARKARTAA